MMQVILDYLAALEQNNNREWYHANKAQYQTANQEFEALIAQLQQALLLVDPSLKPAAPKELTFKMQRDTRFSQDKSPYNPCFRAHMAPQGKLPIPVGYYILVRPGDKSFLGGGLFADMFSNATTMVRDYLVDHGDQWQEIITDPDFAALFTVGGTALKKVPRGYDPNHPQAEYLKYKSWYLEVPLTDKELCAPDFVEHAVAVFRKMQPFNAFLNQALQGFEMPQR